ncbi:MAG: tetratricopeptide repeat protein [Pseudomonadota bacterium]
MSDDSFIREVEEELRNERLQNFWSKYGTYVVALAVLIVVGTASLRIYEWYQFSQASKAGDAFMEAVRLSDDNKTDDAIAALKAIGADSTPTYKGLASLRLASELAKKGESKAAIEAYDALAADGSVNQNLRSIARIRSGMLLVDHGTVADVEGRVGQLAGPSAPYRFAAREAMGLAYLKAGDLSKAHAQFTELANDTATPQNQQRRVRIMLELIASRGGPRIGEPATAPAAGEG